MFKKYNKCIYCNSKKFIKAKKQNYTQNFYIKAIKSDLNLTKKDLNNIKVYECSNCKILQNNPWFDESISQKIYSNIYGQHHRGWGNLLNFIKKGIKPNHGNLFKIITDRVNIKSYAEYSNPFNGLMLNFFSEEYKKNLSFYKNLSNSIIKYLTSRQSAGKTKNSFLKAEVKANKFLKDIHKLKKKNLKHKLVDKVLFRGDNNLSWGQNDNYKSVNSKSFASEFLDLKILDQHNKYSKMKFDVFGIFHTLDHTFNPYNVLNYALKVSKYVVVYAHIDKKLNKQHLFSLTENFLNYLKKQKIDVVDLSNKLNKKFSSPELYFICSKRTNILQNFRKLN